MALAEHLVATTRGRDTSLLAPDRAGWLWTHLQGAFPDALACTFMLDHVHLVALPDSRARFRRILASFTVRFEVRFDVLEPQVANTTAILGRMIRYGYFNAPREGLVDDPWSWPWSTLRDLAGATRPIWTPMRRVASALRLSPRATLRALTTIADAETPPPERRPIAAASIDAVRDAVASTLRLVDPREWSKPLARRLVVQACHAIGSPRAADLADALDSSERSIHRDRSPRHPALDAALLCLADARLRIHAFSPSILALTRRR